MTSDLEKQQALYYSSCSQHRATIKSQTRMWANAQPDGHPAEHRWRPLFNAAKFG